MTEDIQPKSHGVVGQCHAILWKVRLEVLKHGAEILPWPRYDHADAKAASGILKLCLLYSAELSCCVLCNLRAMISSGIAPVENSHDVVDVIISFCGAKLGPMWHPNCCHIGCVCKPEASNHLSLYNAIQ